MTVEERLRSLLSEACRAGASVVHLIADTYPRIRKEGELLPLESHGIVSREELDQFVTLIVPDPDKRRELDRRGEGQFRVQLDPEHSLSTAVYRSREQWRVVLRLT
jgi:Tfp pilus assembly pilus retraction ATPase PilT